MNIQRFISTLLTVLSVCLQHQSRTDNSELNVNSIDESQTSKQHVTSNFMIHPVTPNSKYELRLSSDLNLDKYAMLFTFYMPPIVAAFAKYCTVSFGYRFITFTTWVFRWTRIQGYVPTRTPFSNRRMTPTLS
jgi:hypothetical protein